jgi:aspartyl-tRNA(Asn)/glutamyl-tRNA(Gln) amidotransferase subunit B
MRTKEVEQEYRYFPDPDLVPMEFDDQMIEAQRAALPELPDAKKQRFMDHYGLPAYDAEILTSLRSFADFYEEAAKLSGEPKVVSNWMMGDLSRLLNAASIDVSECKVTPSGLASLLELMANGTISGKIAKSVFEDMFETGKSPGEIVKDKGMVQITNEAELYPAVDQVISENPGIVADFLGGKEKSFGFLVGQVMKYTKGRGNPQVVHKLLRDRLAQVEK